MLVADSVGISANPNKVPASSSARDALFCHRGCITSIMFFEIRMKRIIVLQPDKLYGGVLLKACILTQLLEDMKTLKCSEDHGYYVIPTTLENLGDGKVRPHTGAVVFPVEFKCMVFKPYKKEILHGEVKSVLKHGCMLSCGPLEDVFLHAEKMVEFSYQMGESEQFSKFKSSSGTEIQVGTVLRFAILGLKWFEEQRQFRALATLEGDYLGVVSAQPEET